MADGAATSLRRFLVLVILCSALLSVAIGATVYVVATNRSDNQVRAESLARTRSNCLSQNANRASQRGTLRAVRDFIAAQPSTPTGTAFLVVLDTQIASKALQPLHC